MNVENLYRFNLINVDTLKFWGPPLTLIQRSHNKKVRVTGRPSRCAVLPPSERRTRHLAPEDGRSLTLTLARPPQRSADTAKSATACRETDSRSGHTVVTPACTPVTSARHTQLVIEKTNLRMPTD